MRSTPTPLLALLDLKQIIQDFGTWATVAVVAIIFAETGLLIGFFLPGDSLLFTAGLLSGTGILPPLPILALLVWIAAVVGDQVGYLFGRRVGPSIFNRPNSRFFKQEYVERSQAFFDRHGSKTIVLARFVPVVRTFAPVLAGVSKMHYRTFVLFNIVGGFLWAVGITTLGWALGNRYPAIGENLDYAIVVIVVLSLIPVAWEYRKHRRERAVASVGSETATADEIV